MGRTPLPRLGFSHTRVRPILVVEVSADLALDGLRWRHPCRSSAHRTTCRRATSRLRAVGGGPEPAARDDRVPHTDRARTPTPAACRRCSAPAHPDFAETLAAQYGRQHGSAGFAVLDAMPEQLGAVNAAGDIALIALFEPLSRGV
jgi:hypothetical protein